MIGNLFKAYIRFALFITVTSIMLFAILAGSEGVMLVASLPYLALVFADKINIPLTMTSQCSMGWCEADPIGYVILIIASFAVFSGCYLLVTKKRFDDTFVHKEY